MFLHTHASQISDMTYFSSNYARINYPVSEANSPGLRNAQIGAIHAIGAHFALYGEDPALVIMPTGSGKTAVLNLSAYLLRAKRVLVISSSVMVRGQIKNEFLTLKTLKESRVFHADLDTPKVKEIRSPIKSADEWTAFADFEVVVGIPNSINQGIAVLTDPELFDLVLVDEAHHVPAFTWSNIVRAFPRAKKIFFTATPFRRDKKEIEGRIAFNYPLAKAYEDKIFGEIGYYPVITNDKNPDLAIAKATEKVFNEDTAVGLRHYIMVRTETKEHAQVLSELYESQTTLRLQKVDSTKTYNFINKTIAKLRGGELDGIICVDMLGEGFDFPNLKIAAIHSPKKSLANTLQFIGRFARTNAENIGEAKFLAVPNDIEIGKRKLYAEGAVWNDIIKNLSQEVTDAEDELKQAIDSFNYETTQANAEEISFYNLNPYCHVKIYKAEGIDLNGELTLSGQQTIHHAISTELNTVIFITKETEKPKWILSDELLNVKHYFFLVYYDEPTKLLFLHSSIKTPQFYDNMVEVFAVGDYTRISKYQINKVLLDVANPEFFNIGMLNRSAHSGESYRITAGPNAETTIKKSHVKNYANGHVFMKGNTAGSKMTVGYSSASKVWSNAYEKIPNYVKWCQGLAAKIVSTREVKTNTAFDDLPIGKVVDSFPLPAHGATWNNTTFSEPPLLYKLEDGEIVETYQLLDFDIELDKINSTLNILYFKLIFQGIQLILSYDFDNYFLYVKELDFELIVEEAGHQIPLLDYLNECPLQIYLDDFATIGNHEYYAPPSDADFHFDDSKIQPFSWTNTDVKREFYITPAQKASNGNLNSIHETLQAKLIADNYTLLIYDHGQGEVADFISFMDLPDRVEINLYHIKGSGGITPGDRVNDVYEVCMQAVKSQAWTVNRQSFSRKILQRTNGNPRKFLAGNPAIFQALMSNGKRLQFLFTIVQPGISQTTFSPKLSYILAAADDSITNSGYLPMLVIGS